MKISHIKKIYTHKLDGMWEWRVNIWFDNALFAAASINCTSSGFMNKEDATRDMENVSRH